jgi:hypothetical protein
MNIDAHNEEKKRDSEIHCLFPFSSGDGIHQIETIKVKVIRVGDTIRRSGM